MSFTITVRYTHKFRRLATSRNTSAKLADNELSSTGSRYASTTFQNGKVILTSSFVPHYRTYAYKVSLFSGFVDSPPPLGNTTFLISSLLLLFPFYVHRLAFLCNFGRRPAYTSVLASDMALVNYHLLQFQPSIPTASVLHVLLFSLYWDCQ